MLHPDVQKFKDKMLNSEFAFLYQDFDFESIDTTPQEMFFDLNAQKYVPIEYKPHGW